MLTYTLYNIRPGDEDQKAALEDLVASYDPLPYWTKTHPFLLSTIQYRSLTSASASTKTNETPEGEDKQEEAITEDDTDYYPTTNTNTHRPSSTEAVQDSLTRLPPSTTKASAVGPWIYARSPTDTLSLTQSAIGELVAAGTKLLREFEDAKATLEAEHARSGSKSKAALTRKLTPLRKKLESDLFAVAREKGVVTGKWMLFPSVERVDEVWAAVAGATRKGELGVAAKVATDDGSAGGVRLIAVYTRDYEDKADVKRVLDKLVQLGVVQREGRPIYYKCDAWTYLEIKADNEYGLRASLFSSRDVWAGKF